VGGLQDEQRVMGLCSVSHEFSSAFILLKYKMNSGSQLLTWQATGHEFPMSLFVSKMGLLGFSITMIGLIRHIYKLTCYLWTSFRQAQYYRTPRS